MIFSNFYILDQIHRPLMDIRENIDIDMNFLENSDIEKGVLRNIDIDIDKGVLQNIDIDKILY